LRCHLCHERCDVFKEAVLVRGGADGRDRSAPVVDIGSDDPCPGEGRPPAVLSISLLPCEPDVLGEAPPREIHEFFGDRVRHRVDEGLLLVSVRFPAFPPHRAEVCYIIYTSSMALSIKSDEADQLARELAAETGETLTEAVVIALRERLDREHARHAASIRARLARLAADVAALPVADSRAPEEIIGYDDAGLPR
jgi:antitoxin VapB